MATKNTIRIQAADTAQRSLLALLWPLLALALLAGLAGCGKDADRASRQSRDVRAETATVARTAIPRYVTATGGLVAEQTVMVSTRMMGWVEKIHVKEGQHVRKGDPLLDIDDTDLQAKRSQALAGIAEAKAVLANAEKMAERFERLYAEKSVSKQQLDDVLTGRDRAAAGVRMAEAGLREVDVHLDYLNITAPTDGLVARKLIEEGNMANPGMPLINLEQTGRLKMVAHLGEKDVSSVSAGDSVLVEVTSLDDAHYRVTLDRVIPTANPGSRTYDIEAYLDNPDGRLKSGMFARANVPVGTRQAILVPVAPALCSTARNACSR